MQQGDYNSPYYQHYHHPPPPPHLQNPSSIDLQQQQPNPLPTTTYASAPPFTPNYSSSSDYPTFSFPYPPPYSHNPDPSFPPAPDPLPETQSPYPYYPPYDHHQTPPNSGPSSIPPTFSASYTQLGSSLPQPHHMYESSYESGVKFDHGSGSGGYIDEGSSRYGRTRSDLGLDFYDRRSENAYYDRGGGGVRDDGLGGDGVYAYDGGRMEPYGARGTTTTTTTVSKSSTWSSSAFDDYGRSLSIPSLGKDQLNSGSPKIVRAVPKVETETDVKNGVQKFRVKLLPEGSTQGTMDVLCQIGLDGIRMLDPNTSRTLRIYPLETLTRWEANSSIFNFWSKSSVDIEPRRIRLQSNSYTTNTILDTVTAATVQMKEMGEGFKPSDSVKTSDQPSEKKKGFPDWMNLMKPGNEEKDHWVPDEAVSKCTACGTDFNAFVRKHHCRNCGDIYCDKCTHGRIALTADENAQPVRVCDRCMAEVTQRLSSAKESASKHAGLHSHEDLAKKLQEVMDRNRKASSGSKSDGSGRRMREVACPTCTVHLQVQVPSSGSETIECGVCQHPFLVSAN